MAACSGSSAGAATPSTGTNPTAAPGSTTQAGTTPTGRAAEISELTNAVESRPTGNAGWQTASEGQQLQESGGVKTGDESRVRVDISDGTVVRVASATEFTLVALSPEEADPVTKFVLEAGKLFVRVTRTLGGGSFEIETPSGVATVRGSLMSAEYSRETGRFLITCLEGECRIADQARQNFTDLQEGEQSEIAGPGQGPLAARLMDEAQLDDWAANFPGLETIIERLRRIVRDLATPTPPGGGSAGGLGGTGQTACDHPYLPMRSGATWTYSTESGATTWTVSNVTGDTASATAELRVDFGSGQVTWHFQCDANGITSFDFGSISSSELGQFAIMNVKSQSGVFLPPPELLAPGYGWSNTYELEIEINTGDQKASGTNSRSEQSSVTGAEAVTIGGQAHDGLQISRRGTSTLQLQFPGVSTPPIATSDTGTMTLARGVGIVQTTSQSENFSSQSDLTSYNVP